MIEQISIGGLAEIVGGRLNLGTMPPVGGLQEPLHRIVTDSRQVQPGDVFWGIEGRRQHGGHYALEALGRGAAGVVTDCCAIEPWAGTFTLHVEHARLALWELAEWCRFQYEGTLIAVAGATGKTTTRWMIEQVLAGKPSCQEGESSLPLDLIHSSPDHAWSVVEMENQPFERIGAISHLCRPQILVITSTHDGYQPGLTREEAAALLSDLPDDGCAILNGDDPQLLRLADACSARILWVGRGGHCDLAAREVCSRNGSLSFWLERQLVEVPVWGRHHLTSILAAFAVARRMHVRDQVSRQALAQFELPPGRCRVSKGTAITIVDDTAHASSASLQHAWELLRAIRTPGKRIAVVGTLADWNSNNTDKTMRAVGDRLATSGAADVLLATGPHARQVVEAAVQAGFPQTATQACHDLEHITTVVDRLAQPGDTLLVSGSGQAELQHLVEHVARHPARLVA